MSSSKTSPANFPFDLQFFAEAATEEETDTDEGNEETSEETTDALPDQPETLLTDDVADDENGEETEFSPDSLPEHMVNEDGDVDVEELGKAWLGMRKKLSEQGGEDEEETEEETTEPEGEVPESPDDYPFEPGEDLEVPIPEDDPALNIFKEAAHEHGLTDDQFQGLVNDFLQTSAENGLVQQPMDPENELERLGENGQKMVSEVTNKINALQNRGILSEAEARDLKIGFGTAEGVQAASKLFNTFLDISEEDIPTSETVTGEDELSDQELMSKVQDPRYWKESEDYDPAYYEKWSKKFKERFGEQPG